MNRKMKILVTVAGLGLLVVGLFASSALAETPSPTPTPNGGGYGMPCHGAGGGDPVTLTRVAALLNITADQLKQELTAGKTLAQVAQAKGISEDAVATTILAPRKDMLAVMARYGYLTQEQADQIYQRLTEVTKTAINTAAWGTAGYGSGGMMQSGTGYGPGGMMQGGFGGAQSGYGSGMMRGWGRNL